MGPFPVTRSIPQHSCLLLQEGPTEPAGTSYGEQAAVVSYGCSKNYHSVCGLGQHRFVLIVLEVKSMKSVSLGVRSRCGQGGSSGRVCRRLCLLLIVFLSFQPLPSKSACPITSLILLPPPCTMPRLVDPPRPSTMTSHAQIRN